MQVDVSHVLVALVAALAAVYLAGGLASGGGGGGGGACVCECHCGFNDGTGGTTAVSGAGAGAREAVIAGGETAGTVNASGNVAVAAATTGSAGSVEAKVEENVNAEADVAATATAAEAARVKKAAADARARQREAAAAEDWSDAARVYGAGVRRNTKYLGHCPPVPMELFAPHTELAPYELETVSLAAPLVVDEHDALTLVVPSDVTGVWRWNVACVERESDYKLMNRSHPRTFFHRPAVEGCYPPPSGKCFRAVHDNVFTRAEAAELLAMKINGTPGAYMQSQVYKDIIARLVALFATEYDISVQFASHNIDVYNVTVAQAYDADSNWGNLHSDFLRMDTYMYTAVAYFGTWGEDFTGGTTGFIDEFEGHHGTAVARAMKVRPLPGRVALFTGGGENMHCKNQVMSGSRAALQVWFDCGGNNCAKPK